MASKQLQSVKNILGVITLNLTAVFYFKMDAVRRELGWIPAP